MPISSGFVRVRPVFPSSRPAKALDSLSETDLDNEAAAIERSIHPQAVGWWVLAGLAALVGLIVLGQALTRQAFVEGESNATLRALGVSRRQLVLVSVARTLIIGVAGAIAGVVLAFLVSPLTLVGEVKLADPANGLAFDSLVFLLGGLVTIVTVLALGTWPAMHAAPRDAPGDVAAAVRPSRIVAFLVRASAPPSALIGVRHALERGRGRHSVPVGPALLGSILAVTALCATAVFGASLNHLTSTPALYGQPYNEWFSVNQTGYSAQNVQMLTSLELTAASLTSPAAWLETRPSTVWPLPASPRRVSAVRCW